MFQGSGFAAPPPPGVTSLCSSGWLAFPYETPGFRSCQVLWALTMLTDVGEVWLEQDCS